MIVPNRNIKCESHILVYLQHPDWREADRFAWQSLMVYMGGLTFDSAVPSKFLKIPNLVAAKWFGLALLDRLGSYQSMRDTLSTLAETGNSMDVLTGYCHLMR